MKLLFITNCVEIAEIAESCGVDRIFVDLEIIDKKERQAHRNTLISNHSIEDVAKIAKVLRSAELLVRVNPWHDRSKIEIQSCLDAGAQRLMLPMFKSVHEVECFVTAINGRAKSTLLLETPEALARLNGILAVPGVDEIHIGLNDLHMGMNLDFMFELLSGGLIDHCSRSIKEANIDFGFGGVAPLARGVVPGELILAEHARLGSQAVILSRDFQKMLNDAAEPEGKRDILVQEIDKVRAIMSAYTKRDCEMIEQDRLDFCEAVSAFVGK